jgi:hypothetical protein
MWNSADTYLVKLRAALVKVSQAPSIDSHLNFGCPEVLYFGPTDLFSPQNNTTVFPIAIK